MTQSQSASTFQRFYAIIEEVLCLPPSLEMRSPSVGFGRTLYTPKREAVLIMHIYDTPSVDTGKEPAVKLHRAGGSL
jgi:hypothetical protein